MVDQAERRTGGSIWLETLRNRLYGRLLLLLAVALVFMVLAGSNVLDFWLAALAYAGVVAIAAVVPETTDSASGLSAAGGRSELAFADAVRHFADALPDPSIVVDARSVIVHVNPAAARHFPGVSPGSPIAFTLRSPQLISAIEAARLGAAQTIEMHQTVPTETWYKATIAPLAPGDPLNDGVLVITLQSLTEAKRLESLRTDFIANASHELRTPLTSLVGFIDTLLGPAANDKEARERFLGLMRGQAARMAKLIEDLLSLSRIEMHQHMRPTAPVELGGLLREVAEGLSKLAEDSGTQLDVKVPEAPVTVSGDRDELYEVFENLIDNAIKYGADGDTIEITLSADHGRPGFDALVSIVDHGAGVASEHVPRLTERFYRVDAESSRKKKGTGLGLAIVKHIVTRHRGQLSISSQPGQGTRVDVLLRK
ncbi:ATP-binding protein [Devosia sp. ZB163]|uniref:ATP-binding protein n=1 Tax=Devosia sp. ZB163 TaxID=3025938 RepID=UPI00235EC92F|nr:ATP-binding protein [Devosia sp. ZB163]MDC9823428.1 ATP-binding protein [Devosia sp. ZB163]